MSKGADERNQKRTVDPPPPVGLEEAEKWLLEAQDIFEQLGERRLPVPQKYKDCRKKTDLIECNYTRVVHAFGRW